MTAKAVVPRSQAHRDAEEAIDHYKREARAHIALGFVEALEAAYPWIAKHPRTGSPRYAHELDLPDLRHRMLARYPYRVFCVEHADHIDVWRVLDARRDIPAWLAGSNG
jgi:toxin ParE1/3/4